MTRLLWNIKYILNTVDWKCFFVAVFRAFYMSIIGRLLTSIILVLVLVFLYMGFVGFSFETFEKGLFLFSPIGLLRIFVFTLTDLYEFRSFYIRPFFVFNELRALEEDNQSKVDLIINDYYIFLKLKNNKIFSLLFEDSCLFVCLLDNQKISKEEYLAIKTYLEYEQVERGISEVCMDNFDRLDFLEKCKWKAKYDFFSK